MCLNLLFEIGHGDISPDIPAQVNENGIDPAQVVAKSGKVVIMLDLRSHPGTAEAQAFIYQLVAEVNPIDFWISRCVGIEVACSTSKFG